jgi:hypothetical protein
LAPVMLQRTITSVSVIVAVEPLAEIDGSDAP